MFFTYEYGKRFFSRFKKDPRERLPLLQIGISGFLASIPASIVTVQINFNYRLRYNIQELEFKYSDRRLLNSIKDPLMLHLAL
jgi:hypothetical protein